MWLNVKQILHQILGDRLIVNARQCKPVQLISILIQPGLRINAGICG